MNRMIKITGLAAAGCGVFCLPVGQAALVAMGLVGVAAFICEWEKAFPIGFVAFAFAAIAAAMAGAMLWSSWSRGKTNQAAKEVRL